MFLNNKKYDLIAIGDTVTDAFIRLKEAHIQKGINTDAREICMRFAEKIPYEFVEVCPAVGNSPNAAVCASRLGIKTAIITDVGIDQNGKDALTQFKKEKIGTEFIREHRDIKTNYHYVLWYEKDRTILIRHESYPYKLPSFPNPKWIYLSSLGEHSLPYHKEIEKYLLANPDVKLIFQPGTYQIRFGIFALSDIYKRAEMFFCNLEEAEMILGIQNRDVKTLVQKIHALGPKIVCITDGPNGAYASDGVNLFFIKPFPDTKEPYDRTGAGDAFSATFASAIILGKSIEDALRMAPINSMSVVQEIGAQKGLLSLNQIEDYLKNPPKDYSPEKI